MPIILSDVIQPAQIKQHIPLRFTMPEAIQGVEIIFEYEPHQVNERNNLLTLTVFDPRRVRGEGHKMEARQTIIISADRATPGYLRGEIVPGEWQIVINTHMVLAPVHYRLEIRLSSEETTPHQTDKSFGQTDPRGAGWYRGDLHGHSLHSDGKWDIPDLVAYARSEQLDFVTLTDHNTISGLAQMKSFSANDLLTMGGMELTTYYGHALALGAREWIDWRIQTHTRTMPDILREVKKTGGVFVIAHPMAMGDPVCTGCDWQYQDIMPGEARCVEIWNGAWDNNDSRNEMALHLWYKWLNEGYRMTATTGSDIHHMPPPGTQYGRDVVYAEALSEIAILSAVQQGHLYLSAGPKLDLHAQPPTGSTIMMGDCLDSTSADISVHWADVPPKSILRWIVDGDAKHEIQCAAKGSLELLLDSGTWALAELRDSQNRMLAITNPIFLGDHWR